MARVFTDSRLQVDVDRAFVLSVMRIRLTLLAAAGILLSAEPHLHAQGVEVSPFYGYRFGGTFDDSETGATYSIADSPAYGLMVDLPFGSPGMRTELVWSRQDTNIDLHAASGLGRIDLTVDNFEFGAIREETKDRFVEYISAHVGITHLSAGDFGSDTHINLSAAVGAKFFLSPSVALKAELRAFCTFVDGDATFIFADNIAHVTYTGSTLWQGQATVGLSMMF